MLSKALLLQKNGSTAEACTMLTDLSQMGTHKSNALAALGNIAVQGGNLAGALVSLRELCDDADLLETVQIMPQSAVRYNYGIALLSEKDEAGAEAQFQRVLQSDPAHQGALKGLAALDSKSLDPSMKTDKIGSTIAHQTQMLEERQRQRDQDAESVQASADVAAMVR